MVKGIVSDVNIEGQVGLLMRLLETGQWKGLWNDLHLSLFPLYAFEVSPEAPDAVIWHLCQKEDLVLLTANRNQEGPDSLEATIQACNTPDSLPVLTIADADRVLRSRTYADRVVVRLLEILLEIDHFRGTGRLYLP